MTERISIRNLERGQDAEQAILKTVQSVQRTNPDFSEEDLNYLAGQFSQVATLMLNKLEVTRTAEELRDDVNLTNDDRLDRGGDVLAKAQAAYEQHVKDLEIAVKEKRESLTKSMFGPPGGLAGDGVSQKQASYRQQLAQLATADDSALRSTLDLAQHVGDHVLARAAAAVADHRGLGDLAIKYAMADPKRAETWTRRKMLPTPTTLSAMTRAMMPDLTQDALKVDSITESYRQAEREKQQSRASSMKRSVLRRG